MIGGTVARRIDPDVLAHLAHGRRVVLVTGTNGKSTTTAMAAAAARVGGPVATNANGDNMDAGAVSALMSRPSAVAVLEIDEMHMGQVAAACDPEVIVLLNLSRDQLDRVGEIGTVERHLRAVVDAHPRAHIIANADDPLIASAAWDAPSVTWVSVGAPWRADSVGFPRGGGSVVWEGETWRVPSTEYARPTPDFTVTDDGLVTRGRTLPIRLEVPGRANRGNAAQAALAAHHLGIDLADALDACASVRSVAGRYATYRVREREVHMLLAKNPAGWQEALTMIDYSTPSIVVAVNGQVADSTDLSWIWDVDFEEFCRDSAGKRVVVTGERGLDLAVRLTYAECEVTFAPTVTAALAQCAPGRVELLANYTAFRDAKRLFEAEVRRAKGETK
ncbi:DUF1727 domain-containing protein [Nanchangia anserum]|uniref:Lipid II isoglutaminyl synthase (glutamine-hydrolyzing) subunit MurT n=2 Tax=Nanchangia anserum TaxID=2692125 RepID=A0A8I0GCQ3_9ACTO|nr:DUF1727 domain-containing protein [Nanchangia anserum]QOX82664.1 DUF1727 domain-containing protein [Nanchangia anserum]